MKNNEPKFSLWKEIEHLRQSVDFQVLENKIKTFDAMVKQGLVKDKFQKALDEGNVNIKAEYRDESLNIHIIEFIGIKVNDNMVQIGDVVLSDILVCDIKIDNKSIICTDKSVVN